MFDVRDWKARPLLRIRYGMFAVRMKEIRACWRPGTISATASVNPAAIYELYTKSDPLRQRTLQHNDTARNDLEYQQLKIENQQLELGRLQVRLDVVRPVFCSRRLSSMIAALKHAIAIYTNDPPWRTVRPPLVELTPEQAKTLEAELKAIGFAMNADVSLDAENCGALT
jgi:hypothetical protein